MWVKHLKTYPLVQHSISCMAHLTADMAADRASRHKTLQLHLQDCACLATKPSPVYFTHASRHVWHSCCHSCRQDLCICRLSCKLLLVLLGCCLAGLCCRLAMCDTDLVLVSHGIQVYMALLLPRQH